MVTCAKMFITDSKKNFPYKTGKDFTMKILSIGQSTIRWAHIGIDCRATIVEFTVAICIMSPKRIHTV